jgi:hypothetical protein
MKCGFHTRLSSRTSDFDHASRLEATRFEGITAYTDEGVVRGRAVAERKSNPFGTDDLEVHESVTFVLRTGTQKSSPQVVVPRRMIVAVVREGVPSSPVGTTRITLRSGPYFVDGTCAKDWVAMKLADVRHMGWVVLHSAFVEYRIAGQLRRDEAREVAISGHLIESIGEAPRLWPSAVVSTQPRRPPRRAFNFLLPKRD